MRKAMLFRPALIGLWMACVLVGVGAEHRRGRRGPLPANLPETNPYRVRRGHRDGPRRCTTAAAVIATDRKEKAAAAPRSTPGRFRHGGSDRELFITIRNGIPNTEMPGAFNLPDMEVWRMVGYVQQLGRQGAPEPITGRRRGRRGRLREARPARSATRSAAREGSSGRI